MAMWLALLWGCGVGLGWNLQYLRMRERYYDDPMTRHLLWCEECDVFCVDACPAECDEHAGFLTRLRRRVAARLTRGDY